MGTVVVWIGHILHGFNNKMLYIEIQVEFFEYPELWGCREGTNMLDTVFAKMDHLTDAGPLDIHQ